MTVASDDFAEIAQTWHDDLWWHRKMYRGARWRWWGSHVVDIVTAATGGRLYFTTVDDVRRLRRVLMNINDDAYTVQMSLAAPLTAAVEVKGSLEAVAAEAIGLTVLELSIIRWDAATDSLPRSVFSDIVRNQRMVARQPFKNPLIELLELTQLWRTYQAAANMIEDTLYDLIVELAETRPKSVLADAAGVRYAHALDVQIRGVRDARGEPGDPRRTPRQILSMPTERGPGPVPPAVIQPPVIYRKLEPVPFVRGR